MEGWSDGVMEWWSDGVMEWWSNGGTEWWKARPEGTTGLIEAQGFNPGFTRQKRTALKGRQVWNRQKPHTIPIKATPGAGPFLRPFRAREMQDEKD